MPPWASPNVVVKRHTPEGLPQQIHLCINYWKLNSLLPEVTPAMGNKKGTLTLMSLPKLSIYLLYSKEQSTLQY